MNRRIAEMLVRKKLESKLQESSALPRKYYSKVEDILNHRLGSYETGAKVEDMQITHEAPGSIALKVYYSVEVEIPIVDPENHETYYENEIEYRTQTIVLDTEELGESKNIDLSEDPIGSELLKSIEDGVMEVMTSSSFGFPADEVVDYSKVEVTLEDGYYKVEVRAELSYSGMEKMANSLNKIVRGYDRDSYFDMETTGIMNCYISAEEARKSSR